MEVILEHIGKHLRAGVEILIIWICFYQIYRVFKNTRGSRIMLGLVLLLIVLSSLSWIFQLGVIWWMMRHLLLGLALALLIIFQPELRNVLATLGSNKFLLFSPPKQSQFLDTFCDAVVQLSKKRIGALFAFERAISLDEHLKTGVKLDALFSPEFALTVFYPKTALHDGGMIIADERVVGAACVFPVSARELADRSTGLRHRAAIGITEESDCIAVVVSEETGQISICRDGKLSKGLTEADFRSKMESIFLAEEEKNEKQTNKQLAGKTDNSDRGNSDLVSD